MTWITKHNIFIFVAILCYCLPADATLIDRGNGMIYDTDLNITWLQDANYAKTSHYYYDYYDISGMVANMYELVSDPVLGTYYSYKGNFRNWQEANQWAENLVYGGYDDWRLPTTVDGYRDLSDNYNITSSEMGHLYYVELGNKGYLDENGNVNLDWGLANTGPFINVQRYWYWSNKSDYYSQAYGTTYAWCSTFSYGAEGLRYDFGDYNNYYAWAVRDGDVLSTPEPGTIILVGLGLLGLVGLSRKEK